MANETGTATKRSIEELKKQYEELNKRKIQTQTQLDAAKTHLDELKKTAKVEFGTSDIDELKEKLKTMEEENERMRSEYQTLLEGISKDLKKIDGENAAPAATKGSSVDE